VRAVGTREQTPPGRACRSSNAPSHRRASGVLRPSARAPPPSSPAPPHAPPPRGSRPRCSRCPTPRIACRPPARCWAMPRVGWPGPAAWCTHSAWRSGGARRRTPPAAEAATRYGTRIDSQNTAFGDAAPGPIMADLGHSGNHVEWTRRWRRRRCRREAGVEPRRHPQDAEMADAARVAPTLVPALVGKNNSNNNNNNRSTGGDGERRC
jgi:hypothetical protein